MCLCVCIHMFVMKWTIELKPWPTVRQHLGCLHKSAVPNNFIFSFLFLIFTLLTLLMSWHLHTCTRMHVPPPTHTHTGEFLFSAVNPQSVVASAKGSPPVILGWVDKLFKRQEGENLCSSLPLCILCRLPLPPLARLRGAHQYFCVPSLGWSQNRHVTVLIQNRAQKT